MNIKKPPDRYKTYKNSFKSIIKDNVLKDKIQDAMIRTNKIITRTYMVLRLYLINEFNINSDIFNNNNKDNEFYLEKLLNAASEHECQIHAYVLLYLIFEV